MDRIYPRTVTMLHRVCGKPAFKVENYTPGCRPESRFVVLPDGTRPAYGAKVVCPACGKEVQSITEFSVMEEEHV